MPANLMEASAPSVASKPQRRRRTWGEVLAPDAAGVFRNHFELIEGDPVDKMSKNPPHVSQALALRDWLMGVIGLEKVRQESPIKLALEERSTAEADLVALRVSYKRFARSRPTADGKHRSILAYSVNESVAPLAAPESPFPVAAAFVED